MARKYISIKEFRELGFIQEINRRILHPCGLALEVTSEDDGSERITGVWDSRTDPEGIAFAKGELGADSKIKADKVVEMTIEKCKDRMRAIGFVIQPIDPS